MQAINHALTGAAIGLTIDEPLMAVPAAFGSHFILDAIPHFGSTRPEPEWLRSRSFKTILAVDTLLCFLLVVLIVVIKPKNWLLAVVCAFLAASPDFLSIKRFSRYTKHKSYKPGKIVEWTSRIQWFERPIGVIPEIIWFVGMSFVLYQLMYPL